MWHAGGRFGTAPVVVVLNERMRRAFGSLTVLLFGCRTVTTAPEAWQQRECSEFESGGAPVVSDYMMQREAGVQLALRVVYPSMGACQPAVLQLPGGFDAGLALAEDPLAKALVAEGFLVAAFDPRGRGESSGDEDANGPLSQDDTAAVLRWLSQQPEVDPQRLVVYSRSFGGALAAGSLGRHPDLQPRAWIDAESPGWLREDVQALPHTLARLEAEITGDADVWWAEREPAGLIPAVTTEYHRLQGLPDHALGERIDHTVAMVDGAISASAVYYNEERVTALLERDATRASAWEPLDPSGEAALAVVRGPW